MNAQIATREVTILARVEFKADSRKVVYKVLSSNGADTYQTSLFNGKACSCTCPSRKPCYHMTGCEAHEAERDAERKMDEMAAYYQDENARRAALHACFDVDGLNGY